MIAGLMPAAKDLHPAFQTWNQRDEPLESVEARIHDGVPLDQLHERAWGYLNTLYTLFPYAAPKETDVVVEIGPGVGYIMEAMMNRFSPARIIGLDVAPADAADMIEKQCPSRTAASHWGR